MRCKRRQEAGRGRSEIRSDDVCKHKDTRSNGKMGASDRGWGVEGKACVCVCLCVVVSSGTLRMNSLEYIG